jgi:hypothetical protein
MAPFAEVLRLALDRLIVQFGGMTAGVTVGYAEVARMINNLSAALKDNDATLEDITDLLSRLTRSHPGTALFPSPSGVAE